MNVIVLALLAGQLTCAVHSLSINPENDCIKGSAICQRFSLVDAQEAGILIRPASGNKGLGAFATSFIPMGTLLGEYRGEELTKDEVYARFFGRREKDQADIDWIASRFNRSQGITGNYLLETTDGMYVDCEDEDLSTWCRYMNHDDEGTDGCNVKAFLRSAKYGNVHKWPRMYAINDIEIGEELCWGKQVVMLSSTFALRNFLDTNANPNELHQTSFFLFRLWSSFFHWGQSKRMKIGT